MANIDCCRGCIAPKRHPGCHGSCPEYIKERAAYDAKKTAYDRQREIEYGLTAQALRRSERAKKARNHKKGK